MDRLFGPATPAASCVTAAWIADLLHPFARYEVGSVVPPAFERYARVPHASPDAAPSEEPVPGEPPTDVLERLIAIGLRHTATPDLCWFALWDGRGWLGARSLVAVARDPSSSAQPDEVTHDTTDPVTDERTRELRRFLDRAPRLELPERTYLLFSGPVADAGRFHGPLATWWREVPNLWWPDDRAWLVASEIDLPWTYVAGSRAFVAEVLADPLLQATEVRVDAPLVDGGAAG